MTRAAKTFWILLPWALLIGLVGGVWYVSSKVAEQTQRWAPPVAAEQPVQAVSGPASYHNAVAAASASVVNIYTTQHMKQTPLASDPMFKQFLDQMPKQDSTNLGSGVVVSDQGYIVTNAHVIDGADDIVVSFIDGQRARASVIGSDPESDLAVIQVGVKGLRPLPFQTEPSQVGDVVLAIGNPFGVGQTVTQGIISATERSGLGINTFEDFIQTDAAINPGNSGGALIDVSGRLVGINTAIFSRSGGNMGIGFAIPTVLVEQVMTAIIQDGKVTRGWLGVEVGYSMSDPADLESGPKGVVIGGVISAGPADRAGLRSGDLVTKLNGISIQDANELIQYVARQKPNQNLVVDVLRNGEPRQFNVTLGVRPAQQTLLGSQIEKEQNLDQGLSDESFWSELWR